MEYQVLVLRNIEDREKRGEEEEKDTQKQNKKINNTKEK